MAANTILSLCNGNYSFVERPNNSRYKEQLSKYLSIEEKLKEILDKETFSIFEEAIDCHSIMTSIEIEQAFVEGFSLAVCLLLEAISSK